MRLTELSSSITFFILVILYVICRQNIYWCKVILIFAIINFFLILIQKTNNSTKESFQSLNDSVTVDQRGLVYGTLISRPVDPTQVRNNQLIYANDIVNFYLPQSNRKLTLMANQDKLSLSNLHSTAFSKLRILPLNYDTYFKNDQLYPISYGDPIKLIFIKDRKKDHYVSNDKYLGIIKDDHNNVFQLIKAYAPSIQEPIRNNDQILLKVYAETSDPSYIAENQVGEIITNSDQKNATIFNIILSPECSPNWNFDFDDPNQKLITKQHSNNLISNNSSDLYQQINNYQSIIADKRNHMQQTCNDQLKTIFSERALLQLQINKLKTHKN